MWFSFFGCGRFEIEFRLDAKRTDGGREMAESPEGRRAGRGLAGDDFGEAGGVEVESGGGAGVGDA